MKEHKRYQTLCFIIAVILEQFIGQFALAQTYAVGIPVCDTISTWKYPAGPCKDDYLTFRLDSTLIPYVTGLEFQIVITAINGRIWSNISDTVKVGDVLLLTPPVPSGRLTIFLGSSSSSFQFITKIVGIPTVAYENYCCEIKTAQTTAACQNYLLYWGQERVCQVQPLTAVKNPNTDFRNDYILMQNCPNPFWSAAKSLASSRGNAGTVIRFTIPSSLANSSVRLAIYNLRGELVRELINQRLPAGSHVARWEGKDTIGREVASGIYLYRLQVVDPARGGAIHLTEIRKLSLVK